MKPKQRNRRGAATVEFAITAAVLFFVVFVSIEFSRINMIQNTAGIASYQGARRGLVPGADREDIVQVTTKWLNDVGLQDAEIIVTPELITDVTPEVTVEVIVPLDSNAWISPMFRPDMLIRSECTLLRERVLIE